MNENDMISNQPELELIMDKHGIEKERFVRGVIFAEYIVNGENATNSYMWAFECDKNEARMKSTNLRNAKWVQELIIYFKPDENTLYFGEIRRIIRVGMEIIDSAEEDKDRIAAMNALAKYVKVGKQTQDIDDKTISDSTKMIAGLMDGIAELANKDKMINKHGNIIDVPILE